MKRGEEKELLQGFILVAVAFVHFQKDEIEICLSVLKRAIKKLEVPINKYEGLDVDLLRNRVQSVFKKGEPAVFKV